MPSEAKGLYINFSAQQDSNRMYVEEETRKRIRVKELFGQGVNILEEFGIVREGIRGIGTTEVGLRGIRVHTPSVTLEIDGNEVDLVIQGFKPNYLSPKSSSPNSYEYISVNRVGEDDRNFAIDAAWLFRIIAGEIKTPFSKVNNDPEVIEAAQGFFNVFSQSLSETHTPQTQEVKPEPEKRGLAKVFSRIPLVAKRTS